MIQVHLGDRSYPIYIERGIIRRLSDKMPPYKNIAIVTDDGVPVQWSECVQAQLPGSFVITVPQGEGSKSFSVMEQVLTEMAARNMTRKDAVIAVGGGVVGDLAGFCAASYMRGIDFYNIPTTVLSQVDSSVGGKTAIDLGPVKNIVGAFWQPKTVFIDPEVLDTLDQRQINAGLAEALKMGLVFDENLVEKFYESPLDVDAIITRSIDLKRMIVEEDETEHGRRALLNFGHTIGHAMESAGHLGQWLHGECVAAGMPYMIDDPVLKAKTEQLLRKLGLPDISVDDAEALMRFIVHDKKSGDGGVTIVTLKAIGQPELSKVSYDEVARRLKENA